MKSAGQKAYCIEAIEFCLTEIPNSWQQSLKINVRFQLQVVPSGTCWSKNTVEVNHFCGDLNILSWCRSNHSGTSFDIQFLEWSYYTDPGHKSYVPTPSAYADRLLLPLWKACRGQFTVSKIPIKKQVLSRVAHWNSCSASHSLFEEIFDKLLAFLGARMPYDGILMNVTVPLSCLL